MKKIVQIYKMAGKNIQISSIYEDIHEYKSEVALKEAGKIRMEGKTYEMKDGDIVFFRFNV